MSALQIVANHIRTQRLLHQTKPLFVALQGPQGSGKSYLSALLQKHLGGPQDSLRVVVLSIDDLYLPHQSLVSLAKSHPYNQLWKGRGQPGTHDVQLGVEILSGLKEGTRDLRLPRFEKSLFNGEGDRLPMDETRILIQQPPSVDVVILEGWCVGFRSITIDEIEDKWNGSWKKEREKLQIPEDICSKKDVTEVNEKLKEYQTIWELFDIFIQLRPALPTTEEESRYSVIYQWRLEQEHHMKSTNGNKGMSDAAVKEFVDRYIPGYVFFMGDMLPTPSEANLAHAPWVGRSLILLLSKTREVLGTIDC